MSVCVITVPSMAGDDRHPSSTGPRRFVEAGLIDMLAAAGLQVSVARAEAKGAFRDTASTSAAVNRRVADCVRQAMAAGQFPLVIAGSCVASHGVLAGFDHGRCGAIWIDAHPDFNTPDTTHSGYFPGMSLAVLTGDCYADYWAQIGDNRPLADDSVLLLGVRDFSPAAERTRLAHSRIDIIEWRDGQPQRDIRGALDRLAQRVSEVYLHIDLDGFAPEVAPATADVPVPGGLSLDQAEAIITAASARFTIRAATFATFTPERDSDDRTLRLGMRVLALIAQVGSEGLTKVSR